MPDVDDDFYEDDEPVEDREAAWAEGERGVTRGKRDLNERARSIVDQAVARFEPQRPPGGLRIDALEASTIETLTFESANAQPSGTFIGVTSVTVRN